MRTGAGRLEIVDRHPERVLTISDFEAALELGVRYTFGDDPATLMSQRYKAFPEFAQLAPDGRFTVPIAQTFALDEWRAALEISRGPRATLGWSARLASGLAGE